MRCRFPPSVAAFALLLGPVFGCGGAAVDPAVGTDSEATGDDPSTDDETLPPPGSSGATADVTSSTTADSTTAGAEAGVTSGGESGDPESTSDDPTAPPTGDGTSCCEPHADGGCDEASVQVCVCDELPECCVFEWDPRCVIRAEGACNASCGPGGTSGGESGGSSSSGSETSATACDQTYEFMFDQADATLTGSWTVEMSGAGEGLIILMPEGEGDGTIGFAPEIPCDDQWHVWVRGFDSGTADSFFARLDGEPVGGSIFAIGCSQQSFGYRWRELNVVADSGDPCDYMLDPWVADWEAGAHAFELEYRESRAVSRVVITNDPQYFP